VLLIVANVTAKNGKNFSLQAHENCLGKVFSDDVNASAAADNRISCNSTKNRAFPVEGD